MTSASIRNDRIGLGYAVLTTLFWGSAFVSARYLLGGTPKVDSFSLVFYRFLIGSAVIFSIILWKKQKMLLRSASEWRAVLKVSFFLFWLVSFLFFIGQRTVSATTAALFLESGPALLLILWKLVRRNRTSKAEIVAVIAGLFGCMLVLNIISADGIHFGGSFWGQLAMLGSAISWVIGSFSGQRLMESGNRLVKTAWCELFSALFTLPIMLFMHDKLIVPSSLNAWGAIVIMGVFPSAFAFMAWGEAMVRLPLWKLSLTQNLTPVFTLIGAVLILNEQLTFLNFTGIMAVLIGLSIAVIFGERKLG